MIELTGVNQHYGVRPVLKDVTLSVHKGELVVVLGPNGMGKSTLLGVMGGVLTPQRGTVLIDGLRRRHSVDEELEIRRRALYLPDRPWLPGNRTGREFLLGVGRLYDIPDSRLMVHVPRLLELFELSKNADAPIRGYSAGQQKKVALCSALVAETPVLILDEPFSGGLDPSGLLALKRVLRHLVDRRQVTVVLSSPVPELVEEIADRILILKDGSILALDTLDGLQRMTGTRGNLGEVLEHLIFPETTRNLAHYFEDLPE
jgi:ABC-type multidrug transport system ATPase subunit